MNDRGIVPSATHRQRLERLFEEQGVVKSHDLARLRIPRKELSRLVAEGGIERIARGVYVAASMPLDAGQSLAETNARIPGGVVCLLSALQLHGMTNRIAHEVWLAIDKKAWKPVVDGLPIRLVRFSRPALDAGVETRAILGRLVKVTTPAKTVADCFKFRSLVGMDVAIEALRDYLSRRRGPAAELWSMARVCRVERLMRPYIEALL